MRSKPRKQAFPSSGEEPLGAQNPAHMSEGTHTSLATEGSDPPAELDCRASNHLPEPSGPSGSGSPTQKDATRPGAWSDNAATVVHMEEAGNGTGAAAEAGLQGERIARLSKRATDTHEVMDDRELKRMRRRQKNREAAQRSRQRKAEETESLSAALHEHERELNLWRATAQRLAGNVQQLGEQVRSLGGTVDAALLKCELPPVRQLSCVADISLAAQPCSRPGTAVPAPPGAAAAPQPQSPTGVQNTSRELSAAAAPVACVPASMPPTAGNPQLETILRALAAQPQAAPLAPPQPPPVSAAAPVLDVGGLLNVLPMLMGTGAAARPPQPLVSLPQEQAPHGLNMQGTVAAAFAAAVLAAQAQAGDQKQ